MTETQLESIFDKNAKNLMIQYNLRAFKIKFTYLYTVILASMHDAVEKTKKDTMYKYHDASFIEEILNFENDSITDSEKIEKIVIFSIENNYPQISKLLFAKIKEEYQFSGLYPNIMKQFDVNPYNKLFIEKLKQERKYGKL